MNQRDVFSHAKWVCAGPYAADTQSSPNPNETPFFPILRSTFQVSGLKKATLRILGLGFFHGYLNGKPISQDEFLPLATDYCRIENFPVNEELTGHRIYVPEYDVTDLLADGTNVLSIHFGGGWFTTNEKPWHPDHSTPKAIYRLTLETASGTQEIVSSEQDKISGSFVKGYHFFTCEHHDYREFDDTVFSVDYDDHLWPCAQLAAPLETEYLFTDCPPDRVQETREVTCLRKDGPESCYDTGLNTSFLPLLKLNGPADSKVTVLFSEERNPDGTPDMNYHFHQTFSAISDGTGRTVRPLFTWFAFRYFKVVGEAEVLGVLPVHTNVSVTSSFHCDNDTLNWLYQAYLNTQLSNMHCGIPSDCPHIERKGYTGDGQLTCHAVMNTMDAKAFYQKWIEDIGDCQDIRTGHVQYTAPYFHCGGGPGGWGCAIIEVPYQYYKHYGDDKPLHRLYGQMRRYFDYLDAHSNRDLVISDQPGNWCLGDWCAPESIMIPAPYVNNYFYIKSLNRMIEIAHITGHEADIPSYEQKISVLTEAINSAYYNIDLINYVGNRQGASAFAVDLGIGSQQVYESMVDYYRNLEYYDTGIFGTDILTRVLFEHGDGDLAVQLMSSTASVSFDGMRKAGATSIWENWSNAVWDRSHNHPMFGAVVAYLFDYILGIQAKNGSAGYQEVLIAPVIPDSLNHASGHRTLPSGEVRVMWKKTEGRISFTVEIPENQPAVLQYQGCTYPLTPGINQYTL